MTDEDRQALTDERAELQRKADKRRDQPGFSANVREIDERIAQIEGMLTDVQF